MSLAPGQQLGPYKIQSRLGAGAMGEVFKALDTRLNREVAIKILPENVANDPNRRARFEREARAAAALNNPHIVSVFDIGVDNGTHYIVSELVNGETLPKGPLKTRALLDLAVGIAEGMAAAHAAGITHRDLKPANIMVAADGRAKILDFGLARAREAPKADDATETALGTESGTILGTVNYMSPEQASALPVTHHSDQFSFGVILYEMAQGARPFDKPATVQTMAAIIGDDHPPITKNIPAPLRWIIDRCLAKKPEDRYDSTRDLHRELKNLRDHLSDASITVAAPVAPKAKPKWPLIAAGVLAVPLIFYAGAVATRNPLGDPSSFNYTLLAASEYGHNNGTWSPDGKAIAYGEVNKDGVSEIHLRYLDAPVASPLVQLPESCVPLAWTPDSKRIIFVRLSATPHEGTLYSIATTGGEPRMLRPITFLIDPAATIAISPDGKWAASFGRQPDGSVALTVGSPIEAPPKLYSETDLRFTDVVSRSHLRFRPDGKQLLLSFRRATRNNVFLGGFYSMSIPPGAITQVPRAAELVRSGRVSPSFEWMPQTGRLAMGISTAGGTRNIWLVDTASWEKTGLTSGFSDYNPVALDPVRGRLLFLEANHDFDIARAGLDGSEPVKHIGSRSSDSTPQFATQAPLMTYATERGNGNEIWVAEGSTQRPVVASSSFPGVDRMLQVANPALSPDGKRLVFVTLSTGGMRYYLTALSGGEPIRLTDSEDQERGGSWSPDGQWFAYSAPNEASYDLKKVKTTGGATPVVIRSLGRVPQSVAEWSPRGDWIAVAHQLVSLDGKQSKPIGNGGSRHYFFSKDGATVYGVRTIGKQNLLFSVGVDTSVERIIGDLGPDATPAAPNSSGIRFSLTPDGKHFVYSTAKTSSSLWILDGFNPTQPLLERLGLRLP